MLSTKVFSSSMMRSIKSTPFTFFPATRGVHTPATSRLSNRIDAHLNSSKVMSPEQMPRAVSKFITHHPWSIRHKAGATAVSMHNTVLARAVDIHWDIFPSTANDFVGICQASIPFTISVEDKLTPQGMIFHCSTRKAVSYRYVIERVECYRSHAELRSKSRFRGPRFDTLEPALQEAFDEVLHSWGINTEVVDFIEASSQYYNKVEYVSWLNSIKDFISQ